ncbi:Probable dipeptidyl anminopeptidase [uncultured Rubrobacteraceae bacterium]|uniref:Probable dipeptidyl anminopeptidase n=1 Tax=uncultured Rubrobacteraceae bacterium TaxID=349277 RepID=A0A6J4Q1V6_9ACTN|nr:Probable dipeptidyl anminopeptidase [uncultured Rubrobacteraceae bacterium]
MGADRHLEALLSVPALFAPEVSPDGRWVAWSWSRLGPAADVFAAPTDGAEPPIRLTKTSGGDTLVMSWTPDGEALIVSEDSDGDERVRLLRVRLDAPGTLEPLTEPEPKHFLWGGRLHPNGRWLFYDANFDAETGEEIEATCLYRHDLETGERVALVRPEKDAGHSELNRQGTHLLYTRRDRHPAGGQVWLVDVEGQEDREVLNFGDRVKARASWLRDGHRAVVVAEAGPYRRLGIWGMDDLSVRWLIDDPKRNVGYAYVPPNDGPVIVIGAENARVLASLLDPETGAETRPPDAPGSLIPISPARDGGWISLRYGAQRPTDLVRSDPEGGEATSLTGFWERTPLRQRDLIPAEELRWASVDGLEIQGWLYRTGGQSLGTVVLVHGGPTSHAEDRFNAQIQYLASRGFDVLAPNYRGSTGFGLEFQEKIKEDGWGGREQEDIRCGIEALVSDGIAKPGRVGVTGTSYGGYSAWWAITHFEPEIVAAAAPVCGMTDLVIDYHTTRPDLKPYSEEMMGGSPEEVPTIYRERSPIEFVKNIKGKLLIVQGLKDPNVTPDNVHTVTKALQRENIPHELLTFEDEGHGIARPKNLKILYPRLADFFSNAFDAST